MGDGRPVYGSPAVGTGVVVFGTGSVFGGRSAGELIALDTEDGHAVFRRSVGSAINSSPSLAGGYVFVGDSAGRVLAFRVGWTRPPHGGAGSHCQVMT